MLVELCCVLCVRAARVYVVQIPGADDDDDSRKSAMSPEEELSRRLKDVMRRIFWDRFTKSLLPPPPPLPDPSVAGVASDGGDARKGALREGSRVHARFGSDRGSYYAATVLSVTRRADDSGAPERDHSRGGSGVAGEGGVDNESTGVFVDIRYDEDGMVERGIPASRLKKSDDPPDFGPLLTLLAEVRADD